MKETGALLDPFHYLSLPSPAQSICCLDCTSSGCKFSDLSSDDGDSNSDSSDELIFRSSIIATKRDRKGLLGQQLLKGRLLLSCHKNGDALLWDCAQRNILATIHNNGTGAGMAVKRIDGSNGTFLYQTRDPKGTVTIHSLSRAGTGNLTDSIVREYETYSATFCQAAPCRGDFHLMALPSRQESTAIVMDDRDPVPIYQTSPLANHGMVTSLAMTTTASGKPILACGMESGSVLFHDFSSGISATNGECKLTKDPILALDLAPSESISCDSIATNSLSTKKSSSVVAVAGMAGDTIEVADLPQAEQGRVALFRATSASITETSKDEWEFRTRARLSTCRVDNETSFGKPGVAICRFRPGDARIFAIGGWDNRVRLFERSKGAPMGILRGHSGSVNSLDWAPDADTSGLLVTAGGEDCSISFWQCFSQTST